MMMMMMKRSTERTIPGQTRTPNTKMDRMSKIDRISRERSDSQTFLILESGS